MTQTIPVLTIDGPSGSGKGTISRAIARALGWHYLDSGALYRGVGLAAGWNNIDFSDAGALVRCTFDTEVGFSNDGEHEPRVLVNGSDVTDELRTETAGAAARRSPRSPRCAPRCASASAPSGACRGWWRTAATWGR